MECVNFFEEPPEGEMNALSGNGPKAMRIEEADAAGINSVFFLGSLFRKNLTGDVHTAPLWEIAEGLRLVAY